MKRTHLSLYYLIGYLNPAGLALLLVPQFALKLLFSAGSYGDVLPCLAGVILLALGIFVLQAVRDRLEVLYPTALACCPSCSGCISIPASRSCSPCWSLSGSC